MRCPKCAGLMVEIETGNTLTDYTSCINCGKVVYEHPGKQDPHRELNQGCRTRGRDRQRRAPYGACREISEEDWELGNKEIGEKYGISESWASHLRPVKKYRRRDEVGLSGGENWQNQDFMNGKNVQDVGNITDKVDQTSHTVLAYVHCETGEIKKE